MQKVIDFYSKGSSRQIIARLVITIVVIVVLYLLLKKAINAIKIASAKREDQKNVEETTGAYENQSGGFSGFNDGSSMTEYEAIQFRPTAALIADQQYQAMEGVGTDEETLFNTLVALNGSELNLVAQEFGVRDGKNIFQWYSEELCPGGLWGGCYSSPYWNENVSGCDSLVNACSELGFMQAIWRRWNNTLPF